MQTAKTDQTGRMPRLISVFTGCTGHFVGFVMLQLILCQKIALVPSFCNCTGEGTKLGLYSYWNYFRPDISVISDKMLF